MWGLWLKARGNGQGCVAVWISDSIFWFYYFTPTFASRCNALPKKVLKRIIEKKRQQQIRDEDISFILFFIYWVQQPFYGWGSFSWINLNGWIPQLRCQKYVKSFHVCICPHLVFRASIRVSFLLEVCQSPVRVSLWFICGSCIFQHNADRKRAATGWRGGDNQRYVQRRRRGAQTPESNDVIKTLVTARKRKVTCSPLSRGSLFSFTHASSLFPVRDLWEFLQI